MVDSPSTGIVQTFFCRKWLADDEGDRLTERDLIEDLDWRQQREISRFFIKLPFFIKELCSSRV